MIGRDDAVERGLDHFLGGGGHDEERELEPVQAAVQEIDELGNAAAQAHAPARFRGVLAADTPERRIVANQIRELPALLDQVARRQPVNLALEIRYAEQVAQDLPGIVEAEGLIEVDATRKCLMFVISVSAIQYSNYSGRIGVK